MTRIITTGQNNWHCKTGNSSWQRERMRGVIHPMDHPGLLRRIANRVAKTRG